MLARSFVVHGRVQGVGFRAYVCSVAADLELVGEVWNRRDGKVELIALHAEQAILDELEYRLGRGPGRVDRVSAEDAPVSLYTGFRVGPTR